MSESLLELHAVHTHIGGHRILHGVNLAVPAGEVTMLLGRNGAGKTTRLRSILGLCKPTQGSIHFQGRALHGLPTPDIAQSGIGHVPESMGIFRPQYCSSV